MFANDISSWRIKSTFFCSYHLEWCWFPYQSIFIQFDSKYTYMVWAFCCFSSKSAMVRRECIVLHQPLNLSSNWQAVSAHEIIDIFVCYTLCFHLVPAEANILIFSNGITSKAHTHTHIYVCKLYVMITYAKKLLQRF